MVRPRTIGLTPALAGMALGALALACGAPVPPPLPRAEPAAQAGEPAPAPTTLRGQRYCEVLVAERSGLRIATDIYSTAGVGPCPLERFRALDAGRLADDLGAARVVLKGPRYWTVDRFDGVPRMLDPEPRTLGGLTLRRTGRLEFSVFEAGDMQRPYRVLTVPGGGAWVFAAGHDVHELVAPDGVVFVMLSYSAQKAPLDAAALSGLGERLRLPAGWRFRTRRLATDLRVDPGAADLQVVQDELDGAYIAVGP